MLATSLKGHCGEPGKWLLLEFFVGINEFVEALYHAD